MYFVIHDGIDKHSHTVLGQDLEKEDLKIFNIAFNLTSNEAGKILGRTRLFVTLIKCLNLKAEESKGLKSHSFCVIFFKTKC